MIKERKINSTNYPIQFLMVDSADSITGKTGLSPAVYISKNSGSFTLASGSVSEVGYGIYSLSPNATDRDTLGEFILHAISASAVSEDIPYSIVAYDPFSEISYISASVALVPLNTASASSVSAIPTNPLLTNDVRLDNINTTMSSRASASSLALIPTDTTSASTITDEVWSHPVREITGGSNVHLDSTQGAVTWGQQKIIADVVSEGALHVQNINPLGFGGYNEGGNIGEYNIATGSNGGGQVNYGQGANASGQVNNGVMGQLNTGTLYSVYGIDPRLALEQTLTAIKGTGWTNENLVNLMNTVEAITGISASTIWAYSDRKLTSASNLDLASASSLALVSTTSASSLVDLIWDEVLTGATHNIATSAGRRLRQIAPNTILDGVITGATINSVSFDGDASSVDGAYDPAMITVMSGNGIGQNRLIYQYDGNTKKAWLDRDWKVIPQAGDSIIVISDTGREHVNEGVLRSGSSLSVQLNANASDTDNSYVGQTIFLRSGTGSDQAFKVIAYNGTTKIASTRKPLSPIPDNTTTYVVLPTGELDVDRFVDSIWNEEINISHSGSGTAGSMLSVIPTNPLLTNDLRIPDMIASASLVGSLYNISASTIWEYADRKLTSASNLDLSEVLNSVVEGTYTLKDILSITVAVMAGKASGGGTTQVTFRDLQDTLNRVIATVDTSGNRLSVTLDTTDV